MVLGFLVLVGSISLQLDDAALISRAHEFSDICRKGFNNEQCDLELSEAQVINQDDFFVGCRLIRSTAGRVKVDRLSGYIPYAHFSWDNESTRPTVSEPPRPLLTQRIQEICDSAKYGSGIRVTNVYRGWQELGVHFNPLHNGIRYANWHGGLIKFNLPNGAVSDVSLGWYPAPPPTLPPVRVSVDQARWLAAQRLAAQGDFRPRVESMPTELVITAEMDGMPPGFLNKPTYPRPINKPAVRTDVVGVVRYHVIFQTEEERYSVDHFMFDPTDGRLTWSDRPRPGGGASATSAASKPWTMPVKGVVRVAGKSEKMTIDLAKATKRTVIKGSIMPNCLVLSGTRALTGQWTPKSRQLKVESSGSVYSIKY